MDVQARLEAAGWRVLVIWECETKNLPAVADKLRTFLGRDVIVEPGAD